HGFHARPRSPAALVAARPGGLPVPGDARMGLRSPRRAQRARLQRPRGPRMNAVAGVAAVVAVSAVTLGIGVFGLRISRTTGDFYVASRTVQPLMNASAIGGEYLSAASFLGVAGLVLTRGADTLWYPVGWTAGYLILL